VSGRPQPTQRRCHTCSSFLRDTDAQILRAGCCVSATVTDGRASLPLASAVLSTGLSLCQPCRPTVLGRAARDRALRHRAGARGRRFGQDAARVFDLRRRASWQRPPVAVLDPQVIHHSVQLFVCSLHRRVPPATFMAMTNTIDFGHASEKGYAGRCGRDDLVSLIIEALQNPSYKGVYNGTAPNPVRMSELCSSLGACFASLPVPLPRLWYVYPPLCCRDKSSLRALGPQP